MRCNDVQHKFFVRTDVDLENNGVDKVCKEKSCIPKENYKKFEDHLKEIVAQSENMKTFESTKLLKDDVSLDATNLKKSQDIITPMPKLKNKTGLSKCKTYSNDLFKMSDDKCGLLQYVGLNNQQNVCGINGSTDDGQSMLTLPHAVIENSDDTLKSCHDIEKNIRQQVPHNIKLHSDTNYIIGKESSSSTLKVRKYSKTCDNRNSYLENDTPTSINKIKQVSTDNDQTDVVFILGDNEKLVNIYDKVNCNKVNLNNKCNIFDVKKKPCENDTHVNSECNSLSSSTCNMKEHLFNGQKFEERTLLDKENIYPEPSTSWSRLNHSSLENLDDSKLRGTLGKSPKIQNIEFTRSKSVPPEEKKYDATAFKHRYGVKFNFQQHPQIFQTYMKNKNIELSNLMFAEKTMKFNGTVSTNFDFSNCHTELNEAEALQTPSNASELEFTSELVTERQDPQQAKEISDLISKNFVRNKLPNTVIKNSHKEEIFHFDTTKDNNSIEKNSPKELKLIELPIPK